jgi:hypothetical protein
MRTEDIKVHDGYPGQSKRRKTKHKRKILMGARFSTPIQPSPGVHPVSYPTGTRFLSQSKVARVWS